MLKQKTMLIFFSISSTLLWMNVGIRSLIPNPTGKSKSQRSCEKDPFCGGTIHGFCSRTARQFKIFINKFEPPPYSPDLVTCDNCIATHFLSVREVQGTTELFKRVTSERCFKQRQQATNNMGTWIGIRGKVEFDDSHVSQFRISFPTPHYYRTLWTLLLNSFSSSAIIQ